LVSALPWILLILILLGNVVFWIHLFNRINATGISRQQIKRIEKLVVVACFLLPAWILWADRTWLADFVGLDNQRSESISTEFISTCGKASIATQAFSVGSIASLLWLAPSWILARFRLKTPPLAVLRTSVQRLDLRSDLGDDIFSKRWVRSLGKIPWNQLHLIETTCHEVRVDRLTHSHDGLQVGHLSDLHLTGYMHFEFYRAAVDRLMSTKPDIVVLSGDLIDYDQCLEQVQPLLEPVEARLGCYFVLGNHDRRIQDVERLRAMLVELGWHDLGARAKCVEFAGEEIFFVGSERPWFNNPERNEHELEMANDRKSASLRIGVSHTPDEIPWARRLELDLLFCGHTHGGQVRLPWIGPVVAPSRYGSRYASGWFDCSPTLMHVSRGLSGTHPLRLACAPEVSSIILRKASRENERPLP
jgi:predicted MPP superfamily phosphohydrolase